MILTAFERGDLSDVRPFLAPPVAEAFDAVIAQLGLPLFVKPARAGSSMGVTRVTDPAGLDAAIAQAREHDPKVLVEAAVPGREDR